MKGSNSV